MHQRGQPAAGAPSARRRELAIRAALGAGRGRLLRQLLVETFMLSAGGAALGLALAFSLSGLLLSEAPGAGSWRFELDGRILLFAAGLTLSTALLIGLIPAWQARRVEVISAIKEGDPSRTAGSSRGRFRETLVAAELALSLLLVVGAGLLLRSFAQLRAIDPGFRSDHLLTMGLSLPDTAYREKRQVTAFCEELLSRIRALPGVVSAGVVSNMPLMGHWSDNTFTIEGRPRVRPEETPDAVNLWADPGYFRVAVLLAAVGLYGVMSYLVVQRTGEIGVRMALGAGRGDILGMLFLHGMKPVAVGIAAGVAAAAVSTRLVRSLLYAVSPGDPLTFASVAALLALVAALACSVPALRATRVDPATTLRNE